MSLAQAKRQSPSLCRPTLSRWRTPSTPTMRILMRSLVCIFLHFNPNYSNRMQSAMRPMPLIRATSLMSAPEARLSLAVPTRSLAMRRGCPMTLVEAPTDRHMVQRRLTWHILCIV